MHKRVISRCSAAAFAIVAGLWMGLPARAQYQTSNYVPPTNSDAVVQADMRVTDPGTIGATRSRGGNRCDGKRLGAADL